MSGQTPSSKSEPRLEKPDIREVFETQETPLLKYAYSLTGRRAIAEELVQEVFMQLHQHWDTVDNPNAWLFRSIRNRAFNHKRDNRKEILTDDKPESTDQDATPEINLERMEANGFLRLILAELDEPDRRLIEMKYYEDKKYSEISDEIGITVSNVGYRLHHLLKELAGKLNKLGIDGIQ